MAIEYRECLELIKELHPDLYPIWYIEKDGQYLFNMLKRGVDKEDAASNFYAVDPKSGKASSSIPVMSVYDNDSFSEKLANPNKIPPEDQKPLKHWSLSSGEGWSVSFADKSAIQHHGIKGQKWGVRRFQNEDGSMTAMGKARYSKTLDDIESIKECQ